MKKQENNQESRMEAKDDSKLVEINADAPSDSQGLQGEKKDILQGSEQLTHCK